MGLPGGVAAQHGPRAQLKHQALHGELRRGLAPPPAVTAGEARVRKIFKMRLFFPLRPLLCGEDKQQVVFLGCALWDTRVHSYPCTCVGHTRVETRVHSYPGMRVDHTRVDVRRHSYPGIPKVWALLSTAVGHCSRFCWPPSMFVPAFSCVLTLLGLSSSLVQTDMFVAFLCCHSFLYARCIYNIMLCVRPSIFSALYSLVLARSLI